MANAEQEPEREELEEKKKTGWKQGSDAERSPKATMDQPPKGLRTQGAINIVPASTPKSGQQGMGRRSEPTRHDAMKIAGHERLPGYSDEAAGPGAGTDAGPKGVRPFTEAPELEPMAVPEVPDLKEVTLEADREIKNSADDAESERREEKDHELEAQPLGERKERDAKALDDDSSEAEEAKG